MFIFVKHNITNMTLGENKEIESLLKSIHQGLKKYSIKELNQAIIKFLNKKNDKSNEIEYVTTLVCNHYTIPISTLKNKNTRGIPQDAKQITYCLLHFNIGMPIRQISKNVFNNSATAVYLGIKRYRECDITHAQDKNFINNYKMLEKKLLSYITLLNQKELTI